MRAIDLGHFGGKRTIDIHRDLGNLPLAQSLLQNVNDELRAAETESGDEHLTVAIHRVANRRVELLDCFLKRSMQAVAVGTFTDQHIGGRNDAGWFENWQPAPAHIATEGQRSLTIQRGDGDVNHRGTEDVTGFDKAKPHALGHVGFAAIWHGYESVEDFLDIDDGVKRLHPRL